MASMTAGALSPPTGVLKKLEQLDLGHTQITDAGCAALASALDRGVLPLLYALGSAAAQAAVTWRCWCAACSAPVALLEVPPPAATGRVLGITW